MLIHSGNNCENKFINKNYLVLLGVLSHASAWSCATCGQNKTFTPATLIISFGFFLLPMALVSWIGWVLYRDTRESKESKEK